MVTKIGSVAIKHMATKTFNRHLYCWPIDDLIFLVTFIFWDWCQKKFNYFWLLSIQTTDWQPKKFNHHPTTMCGCCMGMFLDGDQIFLMPLILFI
jgi:hypothetical protein